MNGVSKSMQGRYVVQYFIRRENAKVRCEYLENDIAGVYVVDEGKIH